MSASQSSTGSSTTSPTTVSTLQLTNLRIVHSCRTLPKEKGEHAEQAEVDAIVKIYVNDLHPHCSVRVSEASPQDDLGPLHFEH